MSIAICTGGVIREGFDKTHKYIGIYGIIIGLAVVAIIIIDNKLD